MDTSIAYLESVRKQFLYYKKLGEKTFEQLEPEQLFFSLNENTNSISVIVKHLSGNMLSRWTDFFTTDGEKDWRNRDLEFLSTIDDKKELLDIWNTGWNCLLTALDKIEPEQLSQIIYIRNEGHTTVEAINRQLAHYSYHIGQIVFYGKLLKKTDWTSLSIPKNKSIAYNFGKFSKQKTIKNFTDEELKRLT